MWHIEIDSTTGAYLQDYTQSFIRAENINSYGASNGQVLTSNGDGTSSWANASGGSSKISLSTNSGTLSNDDYNVLSNDENAYILFTNSNGYKIIAKQFFQTNNYIYYVNSGINTSSTSGMGYIYISINKNTKAYSVESLTNTKYIRDIAIDSASATNGQVLTANGSGGASWQNAGGGTTRYHSQVKVTYASGSAKASMMFAFIQDFSTMSASWSSIGAQLNNNQFNNVYGNYCIASGGYYDGSNFYVICGVLRQSGTEMKVLVVDILHNQKLHLHLDNHNLFQMYLL